MIIGIDASRANKNIKSGTEYYSYYLIRNLAKIDSKNQYILYTNEPLQCGLLDLTISDNKVCNSLSPKFDKNGYQIIKSPYNNFKGKVLKWPWNYFWTIGRLSLEMLFNKPDILFVPAHSLPLILPKKTINTIHDVAFEREENVYENQSVSKRNGKKIKLINFLVNFFTFGKYKTSRLDHLKWSIRHTLRKASKIITVSNFTKKEIIDIYNLNEKQQKRIITVHNGYNHLLYKKINDQDKIFEILSKHNIEAPYILYIGRLEKKKNIPALIEAFAESNSRKEKGLKLILLGFNGFGFDEVKYLINDLELEDDVIMPGWVDEADIPYIYNGSEAFIFPSKHEGFGIPVIQAMGCGVPVACSDIPALREVAKESALFFCPYNVESIKVAIDKIIFDQDLRSRLIKKGQERAKEFNWRKCAEETLKVINSC